MRKCACNFFAAEKVSFLPEQINECVYDASQIQVLEGLEAVRKRPGMYIGSTDQRGLHHLVTEIVDNSIDEVLAGVCDRIAITLHVDSSVTIEDNGRGIPVGMHPTMNKPAIEVAMTMLHAGGKFGGNGYKVSGGLHGVGLSVVNALSSFVVATVKRDGHVYTQRYENGDPVTALEVIGDTCERGTTIWFMPNADIFETTEFSLDIIASRMREMAFLNRGVTIEIDDERVSSHKKYHYEGGIVSFVQYLNKKQRGAL